MAEATNHNEAGEVAPSTVEQQAPSVSEENAPSTSSPETTAIPSANAPDPAAANPATNPNAAKPKDPKKPGTGIAGKADQVVDSSEEAVKPAKAKKEKAPALEDKPFADFIQQDYIPALQQALAKQGVKQAQLSFEKKKVDIVGFSQVPDCWQIVGKWQSNQQPRQFNLFFFSEDINGQKGFSYSESGSRPSTLESFLIDERKVNLELLVFGAIQRLNAQKWLVRN